MVAQPAGVPWARQQHRRHPEPSAAGVTSVWLRGSQAGLGLQPDFANIISAFYSWRIEMLGEEAPAESQSSATVQNLPHLP